MNHRLIRRPAVVLISILATILALSPISGAQRTDSPITEKPTLVTDKISYLPGETIIFTGGSWKPGEGVTIVVKADSAGIVATVQGSAGENGRLDISTTMPKLPSSDGASTAGKNTPILTATATGSSGSVSTKFTLGHAPTTRPHGCAGLPNRIVRSGAGCRPDARESRVPTALNHWD